jgi:glutamine synthetase
LTDTGAAALGGVVAARPELLAALAPSPVAYVRLQPHHWAGAYSCWGVENREAAVRFIPGTVTSRERSANFEVKVGDGGANPYVAMALLAAAALDGIERGASLPDPVQDDPASFSADELARRGIARLPTTLGRATELFAASPLARRTLGDVLHDAFTAVRRREWETYGALSEQQAAEVYRWRY